MCSRAREVFPVWWLELKDTMGMHSNGAEGFGLAGKCSATLKMRFAARSKACMGAVLFSMFAGNVCALRTVISGEIGIGG